MTTGARLCIDFGSTYTKLAVRPDWDSHGRLAGFDELGTEDDVQVCVPSIVCESRRAGKEGWYFGAEAMELKPGDGLIFHRNWKSHFVRPQDDPDPDLLVAAGKFFTWLREFASRHPKISPHIGAPVRMCVPDFNRLGVWRGWFQALLAVAGWNCRGDFLITEPYANLVGALTLGRNKTWIDEKSRARRLMMLGMFDAESDLLGATRRAVRDREAATDYGAIIVDVGAYTTDFGYLYWADVSNLDSPPRIETASEVWGMQDLERQLDETFDADALAAVRRMSFVEYERVKRSVLGGREYAIPDGELQRITGGPSHQVLIQRVNQSFSQKVLELAEAFRSAHGAKRVDSTLLTGGGTLVPQIRATLERHFQKQGSSVLNLADESLFNWKLDQPPRDELLRHNRLLVRGGSAVGGASVFIDSQAGRVPLI